MMTTVLRGSTIS